MSLLSRALSTAATHELAALVTTLLGQQGRAAPRLPCAPPAPPRAVPAGPSGLGTAAARIAPPPASGPAAGERPQRPAAPASVPALYCPPAVRDDPALAKEVNDRLIDWAAEVGIYAGRLEALRATDFGRLLMLTHPDTDDADRLLAAAKCGLAEWAADDHYCDDESAGADPRLLGPRLCVANAAVDPAHLPVRYAPELEGAIRDDPVLTALRSALDHITRYAGPAQTGRLAHEISGLFAGFNAEAGWRTAGRTPPVWEYLVNRQCNSFLPMVALVDAVGGYQVPATEYYDPRVRRAFTMACTAATLVNDLYSMARESDSPGPEFNLPTVIAAEENCSLEEAVRRSALLHDELVHTFETEAAVLAAAGSPALRRFLAGTWAWLGGNREWHSTTPRYHGG
ncbi:family 2 encapsulin nanocompartment cargo protein terpene cyclase [Streptomyces gamaensis]|uniref:Terpene synthase n=1 Tax=Streptomyces gamaensis TaxID=1763542 RepID=A0ABW0Z5Z7_9ACTN